MAMLLVHYNLSFIVGMVLTCGTGAQTSIVQSLTYFEHLSEPMAEFLHILAEQYDYPQLSDEILKYVWDQCFVRRADTHPSQGTREQRIQLERYARSKVGVCIYREAL